MEKKTTDVIVGIITVVLGILLIFLKQDVITIALTILGIALIISSIVDAVRKLWPSFIVKLIVGIAVILLGWLLVSAALYILAVLLIIIGALQIYENVKAKAKALAYLAPAISIIFGIVLFFNQGGAVSWMFIFAGISLIVEGVLTLVNVFTSKKTK